MRIVGILEVARAVVCVGQVALVAARQNDARVALDLEHTRRVITAEINNLHGVVSYFYFDCEYLNELQQLQLN